MVQEYICIGTPGSHFGLFNKEPALRRYMTAHPMLSKTCMEFENGLLGNRSTSVFHHEETKTFQEKFDTDVKRLVEVIEDKLSIFSDDSGELFTLYTKHVADEEGVLQLRMLKENAIDIYQKFVKTVLIENTTPFWNPIKQFKLDIFGLFTTRRLVMDIGQCTFRQHFVIYASLITI